MILFRTVSNKNRAANSKTFLKLIIAASPRLPEQIYLYFCFRLRGTVAFPKMANSGDPQQLIIDPRSGFCKSNSTFYSKRHPIRLPRNHSIDLTTFISSRPHHGKVAFIDAATGRQLTFSQFWAAVDSLSSCLHDMGIRKGQMVLILSPNSIFFPVVCLSVISLGAVITTANPLNTSAEISKQISDSEPVLIFTVRNLLSKLAVNGLRVVLMDSNVENPVATTNHPNLRIVGDLNYMMKTEPGEIRVRDRVYRDDPATLLYSSGTTGVSKGVISSHGNLIAFIQMTEVRIRSTANEQEIYIGTIPMFHVYGLLAFAMANLAMGSTTVVLSKFDMDDMLRAVEKYRATYLPLVPPILISLINRADDIKRKYNLASLRTVLCGGAPLSKDVIEGFVEKFPGVTIMQGYSMTESNGGAFTDTMKESRRYGTAGLLASSLEARIVDPESMNLLSVNQTGELWLRGPTIMKGYFRNAEATASILSSDGWLRTGDLCYFDEDGFLFVVDRLKELIKYKGYQVAPAELEALLLSQPEIADAAVIPFPDKEVGQFPMAYVVRTTGSTISAPAVMEFIAKQVAPYKRIRRVDFVSSIPKNPSGKILRKDLIKLATSKL